MTRTGLLDQFHGYLVRDGHRTLTPLERLTLDCFLGWLLARFDVAPKPMESTPLCIVNAAREVPASELYCEGRR